MRAEEGFGRDGVEVDEEIAVAEEVGEVTDTRTMLSALIRSFILTLVFLAVTGASYIVWAVLSGGMAGEIFSGGSSPAHVRAISRAVILAICAAVYRSRGTFGRDFGGKVSPSGIASAVVIGCALQICAGFLLNPAAFTGEAAIGAVFDFGDSSAWSALAVSALLSPVCEEIVFRGLIYGELRRSGGRSWMVPALISSLLFAMVHTPISMMPVAFCAGMLFAFAVERYGSVVPAIAGHAAFNVLSYFSGYIPLGNIAVRIAVFAVSAALLAATVILPARINKENQRKGL